METAAIMAVILQGLHIFLLFKLKKIDYLDFGLILGLLFLNATLGFYEVFKWIIIIIIFF